MFCSRLSAVKSRYGEDISCLCLLSCQGMERRFLSVFTSKISLYRTKQVRLLVAILCTSNLTKYSHKFSHWSDHTIDSLTLPRAQLVLFILRRHFDRSSGVLYKDSNGCFQVVDRVPSIREGTAKTKRREQLFVVRHPFHS